ncbi:MAG TPA: Ig-like domain-containing protein, partial [Pyrinomonadaceae bacterium]|nr:Ig-like domain-containing protein [Pyrinomonadaceae bacterium]
MAKEYIYAGSRLIATEEPVNAVPTVSITSPANNAVFTAPANITINATASDSDGTISKVEFYQGNTLLNTDTVAPYSYTWPNVAAGTYSLTAKATDNNNAVISSSSITVISNAPPAVSITNPANNATFTAPANITIDASAS